MRKKIALAVISCLMICLIGIVVWVWPRRINKGLILYNYKGDASIEVKLDGTLHRHLRKRKELRGKIEIDGVEYVSRERVGLNVFVVPGHSVLDMKNRALVDFSDDSFEDISIGLEGDENIETYRLQW